MIPSYHSPWANFFNWSIVNLKNYISFRCSTKWFSYIYVSVQFSSVQSLSRVWLFATPWTARSMPGLPAATAKSLQSCPTLCSPIDGSPPGSAVPGILQARTLEWVAIAFSPGLPIHHQLPEFTQTHVSWVGDSIQPSHPLSSPSPPALNLSQYHSFFHCVRSSLQVAKALEFQLQHHSFQRIFRTDFH